jgi:hypothetical protein
LNIYSVVRKADGIEVHRYNHTSMLVFELFPAADYDQIILPNPDDPPAAVYTGSWKITRLAFRNRFTATEKLAIELAATDNPTAADVWRSFSAALRSNMQDIQVAECVDLLLPDTRAGVQNLEAVGLLAAGRSIAILDIVPTSDEVFA